MPTLDKLWAALTTPLSFKSAISRGRLPLPASASGYGQGLLGGLLGGAFGGGRGHAFYQAQAGDISRNSAVAANLQWIRTSWPQQVALVVREGEDDEKRVPGHPFLMLLQEPNDQYEGVWLQQTLLDEYWTVGNAYCHAVPGPFGPVELNYLPASCTRPRPGPDGRLAYYEYKPGGQRFEIPPSEVLHFRFGINPDNILEGYPPLRSAFCEIAADNALSEWGASLALNNAVPTSGIISPAKSGRDSPSKPLTTEDARLIKAAWRQNATGENRGDVMVMPAALDYTQVAFSPKDMSVSELRKTPEERICALFQIPPGVVGLGAGLDRNTFSNYDSSKKAAWEDNLIPVGDYFASVWTKALRQFPGSDGLAVRYDRGNVRVLHEDESAKNEEALDQYGRGVITLEEARTQLGYKTDAEVLAKIAAGRPVVAPTDPAAPPVAVKSFRSTRSAAVKKKRLT